MKFQDKIPDENSFQGDHFRKLKSYSSDANISKRF